MKNIFLDLDNTLICAEPFEDITDLGRFKEEHRILILKIWKIII